jgi:tripartite-type tricarboxylate transporter receptor subunit TctC
MGLLVKQALSAILALLATSQVASKAVAQEPVAEFYKGRNLTVLIGFGPGGGVDLYGRLLGQHLVKHLPGKPAFVPQNMPGGGGLVALNYLYNVAPKDGSTIIIVLPSHAMEPAMGNANAQWDTLKLNWLGNLSRDVPGCIAFGRTGIRSIKEAHTREITVGATGPSSGTFQHAAALANIFGYRIKIISGYQGTAQVRLAMESGEVDAMCELYSSVAIGPQREDISSGKYVPIVQMGTAKHRAFAEAPMIYDLASNEQQRKLISFIYGSSEVTRPFAAPPGVPADRVAALRKAFWAAATSPELKADAERMQLILDPMTGEQTEAAFRSILNTSQDVIEQAKTAIRK